MQGWFPRSSGKPRVQTCFPLYAGMVLSIDAVETEIVAFPLCVGMAPSDITRISSRKLFPPVRRDGSIKYYTDFEP